METLSYTSICRHITIRIQTRRPTEFIDLTDQVHTLLDEMGIEAGVANIQSLHTTTGVVINEHEPMLLGDFDALLGRLAPSYTPYDHDDMSIRRVNVLPGERTNGHAHCRALLLGTSASLNIAGSRLQLGRWQRIFFVELDGPQAREVSMMVVGAGR